MQTIIDMWKRNHLAPPHVIAWRLIWILPLWLFRMCYLTIVLVGWGPKTFYQMWQDTQ